MALTRCEASISDGRPSRAHYGFFQGTALFPTKERTTSSHRKRVIGRGSSRVYAIADPLMKWIFPLCALHRVSKSDTPVRKVDTPLGLGVVISLVSASVFC